LPLSESIFNRDAARYDNWFEENPQLFEMEIKALRRVIDSPENGIEIGVGTGRFASALGIRIGVDPSRSMLMYAKKRGIVTVQAFGERLPFSPGSFDLCFLTTTVCFLMDVAGTFLELYRILRPGGRVVIGMIDAESWLGKQYREQLHEKSFYTEAVFRTPLEIGERIKEAGFLSLSYCQTLFESCELPEGMGRIEVGFGNGGFVLVCAEKGMG